MPDTPNIQVPPLQSRSENLSPVTAARFRAHSRSASVASSMRSSRTTETALEQNPDIVELEKHLPRQNTIDVEIKISRKDFFMGLFFPDKVKQKVTTSAKVRGLVQADEHDLRSPWVLSVYALSYKRVHNSLYQQHEAQCTIDTGNQQGNIASKDFVIKVLGYTEADFKTLTDREQHGGISASGDLIKIVGAIELTWYHPSSARVFRDMRFLVSSNAPCDLVIGARSIKKHNLLTPPNFMAKEDDAIQSKHTPNLTLQSLEAAREKLEKEVRHKEDEIEDESDDEKVEKLNTRKSKLEKEVATAKKKIEEYKKEHPNPEDKAAFDKKQKTPTAVGGKLDKTPTSQTLPTNNAHKSTGSSSDSSNGAATNSLLKKRNVK